MLCILVFKESKTEEIQIKMNWFIYDLLVF